MNYIMFLKDCKEQFMIFLPEDRHQKENEYYTNKAAWGELYKEMSQMEGYQYPMNEDWTTDEAIDVISFFQTVELAYEKGVEREVLLSAYRRFKEIVPGKAEEKKLCSQFEEASDYSPYQTVKKAKEQTEDHKLKM